MKIKLIFDDWRNSHGDSVRRTEKGIELSMGDFHGGTTFDATIDLHPDQESDLRKAMKEGYVPVFYALQETGYEV